MMETQSPFKVAMPYGDVVSTCVGVVAHWVLFTKKLRNCETQWLTLGPQIQTMAYLIQRGYELVCCTVGIFRRPHCLAIILRQC